MMMMTKARRKKPLKDVLYRHEFLQTTKGVSVCKSQSDALMLMLSNASIDRTERDKTLFKWAMTLLPKFEKTLKGICKIDGNVLAYFFDVVSLWCI